MNHLGDITRINGAEIPPVWCITGGSPCQDLSIAGKRTGLAGARSGLYMEQIRIVRQTLINRAWNDEIKKYVRGFMIESYIADGRQDRPEIYGKSITDPCLGWEDSKKLIYDIAEMNS